MTALDYKARLFIVSVVGLDTELRPHKIVPVPDVDYPGQKVAASLARIRPHLLRRYRDLSDQDLMVGGIYLVSQKSGT